MFFMHKKTWYDINKSTSQGEKFYCDTSKSGKNHRQYRNKSKKTIFREWASASNALIAGQVTINICLFKSFAL